MRTDLPAGTVTFLFTDIEGSTRLLRDLRDAAYADALAAHRLVIRQACAAEGGVEVDTQGDAFFFAFSTAPDALRAAAAARDALARSRIRVRIGIHTGTPHVTDEGYVGEDVHRAARIAAAAHGGQIVVSAPTAALVEPSELRDLGEHRLKDLSAAERIFQVGDEEFPPLKSLHQTNLPVPATPFLGREHEVREISALAARDDVRLLTLTGPGGSGKTRLALQAVGAAADAFPGGIWWVSLAPIRDPALVLETAATALGAPGDLAEHIGDKRLLLLFDNFEQVIDAAPEVGGLLDGCRKLTIVTTSREPLRLEGEWEYAVDPLRDAEAVVLFHTRARAARRDFVPNDAVRQICARLDNLPLAIELAAARVKVLSPEALLERLERRLPALSTGPRDAPARQRTLRATIEWSHGLLGPEEQALFRRLSILSGGGSLKACEEVCGADLDVLASLVDKSLVRQTGERFWMLETIREYASEQLAEAGEADALRRAHADFFLRFVEEANPELRLEMPGSDGKWLTRLDVERDNLRSAFDTLEETDAKQELVRLFAVVWRYWLHRNLTLEGHRLVERVLRVTVADPALRANILSASANFALRSGDAAAAREPAAEALAAARETDDEWLIAEASWLRGWAMVENGEAAAGRAFISEAIRVFDEIGAVQSALWATRSLAAANQNLGEFAVARELHEKNVERARTLGNRHLEAVLLGALATVALDEGKHDEALALLHENTGIFRGLRDELAQTINIVRVAFALTFVGAYAEAATLSAFAEAKLDELGARPTWLAQLSEETRKRVRTELDDDSLDAAFEQGRRLTLEHALERALESTLHARN